MINAPRLNVLVVAVILTVARPSPALAVDLPLAAKVLDENLIMYLRPVPLVSPNGKLVAYVSRGFVCVADLEAGASRRLFEVKGSWTHLFASFDETRDGGDADSLGEVLGNEKYLELHALVKNEIVGLQWTINSDAVVFGVHNYDAVQQNTLVQVWRVPLAGDAVQIAHSDPSGKVESGPALGTLSRDERFLVGGSSRGRPLIWDLATNKPRATPFLALTPSPTGGRWIGVEKDTRQLVVVDEDFKVIRRYEEFLPNNEFGFEMIWSPDERFVIWRQQIGFDYYSNWVGCRYDLQTRDRDILTGDYMEERVVFTGRRGEYLRVGMAGEQGGFSGLIETASYVDLIPDGRHYAHSIWRLQADPRHPEQRERLAIRTADVAWSPDFQLFTIAIPRQQGPYGGVMHLADRQRRLWRLSSEDTGKYISPFQVAGFAQGGQTIIAYDDHRLFAIPVSAIQTPANKIR